LEGKARYRGYDGGRNFVLPPILRFGGGGAGGGGVKRLMGRDGAGFGTWPDFDAMQFPRNVGGSFDHQPKREYQI
jgi:hypothetical protein